MYRHHKGGILSILTINLAGYDIFSMSRLGMLYKLMSLPNIYLNDCSMESDYYCSPHSEHDLCRSKQPKIHTANCFQETKYFEQKILNAN